MRQASMDLTTVQYWTVASINAIVNPLCPPQFDVSLSTSVALPPRGQEATLSMRSYFSPRLAWEEMFASFTKKRPSSRRAIEGSMSCTFEKVL